MKYAIQAGYYMWNKETKTVYEQWEYLALNKHKVFIFEDDVTERTKLFSTAKDAGDYVDKHFGADYIRCSFSKMRIVEV